MKRRRHDCAAASDSALIQHTAKHRRSCPSTLPSLLPTSLPNGPAVNGFPDGPKPSVPQISELDIRILSWLEGASASTLCPGKDSSSAIEAIPMLSLPSTTNPSEARSVAETGTTPLSARRKSPQRPMMYRFVTLKSAGISVDVDVSREEKKALFPPELSPPFPDSRRLGQELYLNAKDLVQKKCDEVAWSFPMRYTITSIVNSIPGRPLADMLEITWTSKLNPVAWCGYGKGQPFKLKRSYECGQTDSARGPRKTLLGSLVRKPEQPKTPRPDQTVGYGNNLFRANSHWESFGIDGQRMLAFLAEEQDFYAHSEYTLCSEISTGTQLRFPAFVFEAKSQSTCIAEAQNQAAVSGCVAVDMLRQLEAKASAGGGSGSLSTQSRGAPSVGPNSTALAHRAADDTFKIRTFSLTSEGPIYEVWAHCPKDGGSDMVWLKSYRILDEQEAIDLVDMIARIVYWSANDLKRWIEERLASYYLGKFAVGESVEGNEGQ